MILRSTQSVIPNVGQNILHFPFYPLPDKKGALLARAPRIGVGISVCLSDFIVQCAGDDFILFRI
jgi:hypothetical protein